jgi:Pro-kumamolisin, activation domain/IPT/TIG domain
MSLGIRGVRRWSGGRVTARRGAEGRVAERRRSRGRVAAAALGSLGLVVAAPGLGSGAPISATSTQASASAAAATVSTVAAAPRLPAGAERTGAVAADRQLSGVVALAPRNSASLARFAAAISTPGNPDYHRYVAAGTFERYFSPTTAAVTAVVTDLRAAGLHTTSDAANNRLLVSWSGSASAAAAAFHAPLADYRLAGGRQAYANTSAASLPATIAPLVTSVIGLNDLVTPEATPFQPATKLRGTAAGRAVARTRADSATTTTSGPAACSVAKEAAADELGLTDTEIADAYGVDGLYKAGSTGSGQTVAVYELEPYRNVDIKGFDTCYFGATAGAKMLTRLKTVAVDGGDPTGPGSAESELDIDDVSALAPGANIDVYEAPQTDAGYLDAWNAIVSDDTAKTVTSSWGSGCETEIATAEPGLEQAENTIFEQAAVQGQTVLDAAGDAGADGCAADSTLPASPDLSVDDPASQPYVTAVGGTTIDDPTDPPVEQVWNDGSGGGAAGGGISAVWAQPSWQAHSTVPGIDDGSVIKTAETENGSDFCQDTAVKTACREIPDVSANADEYTGITILYDGEWGTIGGTSSATPLWAAMLADADSTPACKASGGIGFASPSLYAIASVPAEYKAAFNDITSGDNDTFGLSGGLYPATKGYDMASGLGTPRITGPGDTRGLAYYLCTPPVPARPVVTSITPPVVSSATGSGVGSAGGSVTLTVQGSHFETGGAPDVAGVTIGSYQVTPFTVVSNTELTVTAPIGAVEQGNQSTGTGAGAGVYDVAVTLVGGETSIPTAAARLTITADPSGAGASDPVVDAVTPSGGNLKGGETIRIYGTGFTAEGATSTVTIGGVAASVSSATNTQLTAVVPAYSAGPPATTCASFDANPTTDVCQTQVVVTNASGSSPTAAILPEYAGDLYSADGEAVVPTGYEEVAAPTEFDYFPTPTVTGYTFDDPTQQVASAEGFSYVTGAENEVTVTGTGLGLLGFEWADVGTPGQAASEDAFVVSVTRTSVDLYLPSISLTDHAVTDPLAAQTLGSPNQADLTSDVEPSNTTPVVYAPVPKVTSLSTPSGHLAGPSAGGTTVTVKGDGFYDGVVALFTNEDDFVMSTESDLQPSAQHPDTEVSFKTTEQLAGEDLLNLCTVSGCDGDSEECADGECFVNGGGSAADLFTFYPPGKPTLLSARPKKGPAYTLVQVNGTNLAFPQAVWLGSHKLPSWDVEQGNSDNQIFFEIPRGLHVGRTYDIRVATAESEATERDPKTPVNKQVTFTLTKLSGHRTVVVVEAGSSGG